MRRGSSGVVVKQCRVSLQLEVACSGLGRAGTECDECGLCRSSYTALGAQQTDGVVRIEPERTSVMCIASGGNYVMEAYGRTQLMLAESLSEKNAADGDRTSGRAAAMPARRLGGCPAKRIPTERAIVFRSVGFKMEHGCVLRLYNSVDDRHGEICAEAA